MEKRKKRKGYHGWTNLENSSIDFMMMINYGVKMIVLIMMIRYHDGLEFKCQKNNLDGAQQRKKNYWFRPCYAFNYYAYTTCVDEASYI